MEFLFINVNHKDSPQAIPLPMAYILAYLRRLGHRGIILDDLLNRRLSLYTLEKWIAKLRPALIGFTACQENMETIRSQGMLQFSEFRRGNGRAMKEIWSFRIRPIHVDSSHVVGQCRPIVTDQMGMLLHFFFYIRRNVTGR